MTLDHTGYCSIPWCENTYKNHRWGKDKAHKEGWFFQKNGDVWCPEHIPNWVEEWRKKNGRN